MLHVRTFYIEKDSSPGSLHSDFRIEPVSDELCRIHARLVNRGGKTVFCKLAVEAETDFKPSKYLIPCVMYNGNEYGSRNSPKGLLYQGEPWIFSYDRSGIPSCTVTEDDSNVFALFASDQTPESLRSACSLVKTDSGHFLHRIYYPVTEAPVTYSGKNEISGRYDEWIELKPDAEFSVVCHAFRGKPEWKNYGFASVFRQAWKILKHDVPQSLSPGEVWEYGIRFISDMKVVENGKEWFCGAIGDATHAIGNHISREGLDPKLTLADIERDPKLNFFFPAKKSGGIGFTCQGFMCARLLIADALRDRARKEEPLQFAIRVLDNWLECQLPNGLILKSGQQTTDCCHMGWGIIEMARISELLTRHGMDGKRYLECARKLAGFFIRNYSPETGFGSSGAGRENASTPPDRSADSFCSDSSASGRSPAKKRFSNASAKRWSFITRAI